MRSATPAPRSVAVPYDTPIFIEFAADMDASTFTTSNVYLKLDTQRVPIALSWNAATRRLDVLPLAQLALRRTYTVELGPGVRTAAGAGFESGGWFYQFTTNGERRPNAPRPRPGDADESPFVMLSWDSTEISAGNITYQVWSGPDSAAVAQRAGSPTTSLTRAWWLPDRPWPLGQRVYWAISVLNQSIGERLDGPVNAFTTIPPGLPEDSLIVRAVDYGYNYIIPSVSLTNPYQFCVADEITSDTGTQAWMAFPFDALPANVRIASARLEVYTFDAYVARLAATTLTLWTSRTSWIRPCRGGANYRDQLPQKDLPIATGRQESGRRLVYMSDALAAHVEATVRRGGFYGYEFTSTQRVGYVTQRFQDAAYHPWMKIHYYVLPAGSTAARTP